MLNFNQKEFLILLNQLFFIIIRLFFLFSTAPLFNAIFISKKIRILLSIIISILIYPIIVPINSTFSSYVELLFFLQQIIIGILIGFFIRLIFFFINLTGEIIGLQIGFSFLNIFDVHYRSVSLISRLFECIFFLLFLIFNGHLFIIFIIVKSFLIFPIGKFLIDYNIFYFFINYIQKVYSIGIILSFPMLFILLGLNIIISIINKLSPQISIFSVGFPILFFFSILFLLFFTPVMCDYIIYWIQYLLNLLLFFDLVKININNIV